MYSLDSTMYILLVSPQKTKRKYPSCRLVCKSTQSLNANALKNVFKVIWEPMKSKDTTPP